MAEPDSWTLNSPNRAEFGELKCNPHQQQGLGRTVVAKPSSPLPFLPLVSLHIVQSNTVRGGVHQVGLLTAKTHAEKKLPSSAATFV